MISNKIKYKLSHLFKKKIIKKLGRYTPKRPSFFGPFAQSYADWVLLHKKTLGTLFFKKVFTKFF
jgi:hypothetical protein